MLFLSETKKLAHQVDFLGMSLGYKHSFGMNCQGSRRGLWAAWDDNYDMVGVKASDRLLIMEVLDKLMDKWYLFLVYGPPVTKDRATFWLELEQKIRSCAGPVVLVGDFNQVRNLAEKWSPTHRRIRGEISFNNLIFNMQLIEIPNQGMWYTWSNNRADSDIIYERLDRVLVSTDWFEKFPSALLIVTYSTVGSQPVDIRHKFGVQIL